MGVLALPESESKVCRAYVAAACLHAARPAPQAAEKLELLIQKSGMNLIDENGEQCPGARARVVYSSYK